MKKRAKPKRLGPPIQVRFHSADVDLAREIASDQGIELAQVLRRAVRVALPLLKEQPIKAA